jgi:DNA-binding MarR family transcriptional regulator
MSGPRQWLDLGLEGLPPAQAERVRLFRTTVIAATLLRGRLDRELAGSGITTQQGAMLQFIETQGEPPTIGTVAAGLAMTHQNVKQIALVLERKGFLEIVVDEADRRARRLVPTAEHRRFWKRRSATDFERVSEWTAALRDDEVQQAVALLRKLIRSLREG